jgi:prepilin-type N-terminal cleavage/methylation domain-containing protein
MTHTTIAQSLTSGAKDERGVSLIELIVAIALFAMLGTMVVSLFAGFSGAFSRDRAVSDSTSVAAVGMNEVTRVIRSGTEIAVSGSPVNAAVFAVAADDTVVLQAYLDTDAANPAPVLVRFAIDPVTQELMETRWKAVKSTDFWAFPQYPAGTTLSKRPIARQIVPRSASEPYLFRYLDVDGKALTFDVTGRLTDADRRKVAAVQVTLRVQADPTGETKPAVLQNTVGIPNLGVARVGL